jgi:hypothetical protein
MPNNIERDTQNPTTNPANEEALNTGWTTVSNQIDHLIRYHQALDLDLGQVRPRVRVAERLPEPTTARLGDMTEEDDAVSIADAYDAIKYLETTYGKVFDKKGRYSRSKQEVIVRDPDPVNDDEEAIINIEELAGTLADMDMSDNGESAETHPEKFTQIQSSYKDLITRHKRKLNA